MTQLQKLSIRKIRGMNLGEKPLIVIDRKAGLRAFVIIDYKTYEKNLSGDEEKKDLGAGRGGDLKKISDYDFRGRGFLWDRPGVGNREFAKMLTSPAHADHAWAASRIFEKMSSWEMFELFSIDSIKDMLARARMREPVRRAWEHAIEYWSQKT